MKWTIFALALLVASAIAAGQTPPSEAFRVLPATPSEAPTITPYLKYQTEMAWNQDELRRRKWEAIASEQDLLRVQEQLHRHLLMMIGGLPTEKSPLNARVTGQVAMDGFHVEKLIYESLPRIYVPALVYVPHDGPRKHPAILVPAGHSPKGKIFYQALCQRLVRRGYVVIAWDPVGQGERSQFWDAKAGASRYNLICAEHAVIGNLAYLAGTNLARWEIWDGVRAVDYLLTRSDVDSDRISITGTSGGGTQTAYIAAMDKRIKVAAPSCYVTSLPMRVYNRIFKDPDSDPEQDLYGMISNGVDHPGLLLMMYPRPVFVAAAVLDFFPIEGTHKTFREVAGLYSKFGHADRIAMHDGYHEHQYSLENQEEVFEFIDYFNAMPARHELAPIKEMDEKTLQVTRTGQVMLDYPDARSLMSEIHDYYEQHKSEPHQSLKSYYESNYVGIRTMPISKYTDLAPERNEIRWETAGTTKLQDVTIDRYVLHHSRYLLMPLLWIHKSAEKQRPVLLWIGEEGKVSQDDWPAISKQLAAGYDIISIDSRGLGETRMPYKAVSPDDPKLADMSFDEAYHSPLSGVLADYVYNSLLTGRPYFLQMIEDIEIATRFAHEYLKLSNAIAVTGTGRSYTVASSAVEILPELTLAPNSDGQVFKWSEMVEQKRELWPIEFLLPGGAYIH
ncbi:MAG TPA: acetylxylan esterase [Terriglobales bacterium]|nr:acetylxylan esterase [Terriglobales bacterium]